MAICHFHPVQKLWHVAHHYFPVKQECICEDVIDFVERTGGSVAHCVLESLLYECYTVFHYFVQLVIAQVTYFEVVCSGSMVLMSWQSTLLELLSKHNSTKQLGVDIPVKQLLHSAWTLPSSSLPTHFAPDPSWYLQCHDNVDYSQAHCGRA